MKRIFIGLYWNYLRLRQKMLIPAAYFNEKKRIKLCRIDEELIRLKKHIKEL